MRWYNWILPGLVTSGIMLHAVLVYFELKERLHKQLKKHPTLWGAVAAGALLVATSAIPEVGNLGA